MRAPEPLPRFDNAAMDGCAIRAVDVAQVRPAVPLALRLVAPSVASQSTPPELPASCACRSPRAGDARGADAIEYALREPGRVDQLILLNTYYGHASTLRLPEAIRLLADPELRPLADALLEDPNLRLWLLGHTARRFGLDPDDPSGVAVTAVAPQFFGDGDRPDALAAVRAWTAGLLPALDRQDAHVAAGHLAALEVPVTLVFGAADNYLNPDLARQLADLFRHADLHLVQGASHWPQWDQPKLVARLIPQAAASDPGALLP